MYNIHVPPFKEYWGQAWTDYIVTIQCSSVHTCSFCIQYEPAVPVMYLHCIVQLTCMHCSKFSVTPTCMLIWMSQNSSTAVQQLIGRFIQVQWQAARPLQLHCLSRLNPLIPCVCAFTYLSSSRCLDNHTCEAHQYTGIESTKIISRHAWISGTCVRQMWRKWHLHRQTHTHTHSPPHTHTHTHIHTHTQTLPHV